MTTEKTAVDILREAVARAATTFRRYEALHRGKGTLEGDQKAHDNKQLADQFDKVLDATEEWALPGLSVAIHVNGDEVYSGSGPIASVWGGAADFIARMGAAYAKEGGTPKVAAVDASKLPKTIEDAARDSKAWDMGDPLPSPTKSPVEQRVDALEARVGALERRLQALVLADIRLRPIGGIGGGGDGGSSIGPDLHDVLQQMHNKGISPRG